MKIVLASKSAARKKLLSDLGLKFEIIPADIDEDQFKDLSPAKRVKGLALAKAQAVAKKIPYDAVIIAADTLVFLPAGRQGCQGKFIGKPKNKEDAKKNLQQLSRSTHWLYSGICVLSPQETFLDFDKTKVTFRHLSDKEIDSYVQDPEVLNHAGGYTIEKTNIGEGFIKEIKGSFTNVLGLPMEKMEKILSHLS